VSDGDASAVVTLMWIETSRNERRWMEVCILRVKYRSSNLKVLKSSPSKKHGGRSRRDVGVRRVTCWVHPTRQVDKGFYYGREES
jgi:hypothetical protein